MQHQMKRQDELGSSLGLRGLTGQLPQTVLSPQAKVARHEQWQGEQAVDKIWPTLRKCAVVKVERQADLETFL